MELYLDTANVAEVERLARITGAGVTPPIQALWQPAKNLSGRMVTRAAKRHREGTLFAQGRRDAKRDGGKKPND